VTASGRTDRGGPAGPWWWGGLALGGAVGLFGLAGLLHDAAKTRPLAWILWLGGLLLFHDFVLAPGVHLVGAWLRRHTDDAVRWPLQLGLIVSGVLVLASVPVLYGVGRGTQPGNRSVLPGDYPRALLGVFAVVWGLVLVLALARRARRGRDAPRPPPAQDDRWHPDNGRGADGGHAP